MNSERPRLVYVVSSSLTVGLMSGQLRYLRDRGFDVTVIAPPGKHLDEAAHVEGVSTVRVPMARSIAVLSDLASLWRLCRIVRALRPAVTNVGTPKAGLLGGIAAWLNRVPCRIYTLRGLRFETTIGMKRRLLICLEWIACRLAHRVICVSHSLCDKAIASGIVNRDKTVVFGSGGSNGVDVSRFAPSRELAQRSAELRRELGIPSHARVVGFVGRLTRDKGIPELAQAFAGLDDQFPDLRLVLLGRFEEEDPIPADIRRDLEIHPGVIVAGFVDDTPRYYALMDVLVLPSHREGLSNVLLEAQATRVPVVAARATGIVDIIVDGETGLLVPAGDVTALRDAIARVLVDKAFAEKLAWAGYEKVKGEFRQEQIWDALYHEYLGLLHSQDVRVPRTDFTAACRH